MDWSDHKTTVFLWDIDGTLLLSGGAGIASFNHVFEELYGERHVWNNIHPDGKTDDAIIEELFFQRFNRLPTSLVLNLILFLLSVTPFTMSAVEKRWERGRLLFAPVQLPGLFWRRRGLIGCWMICRS